MYILVNMDVRMEIREGIIVAGEGLGYPTAATPSNAHINWLDTHTTL